MAIQIVLPSPSHEPYFLSPIMWLKAEWQYREYCLHQANSHISHDQSCDWKPNSNTAVLPLPHHQPYFPNPIMWQKAEWQYTEYCLHQANSHISLVQSGNVKPNGNIQREQPLTAIFPYSSNVTRVRNASSPPAIMHRSLYRPITSWWQQYPKSNTGQKHEWYLGTMDIVSFCLILLLDDKEEADTVQWRLD